MLYNLKRSKKIFLVSVSVLVPAKRLKKKLFHKEISILSANLRRFKFGRDYTQDKTLFDDFRESVVTSQNPSGAIVEKVFIPRENDSNYDFINQKCIQ